MLPPQSNRDPNSEEKKSPAQGETTSDASSTSLNAKIYRKATNNPRKLTAKDVLHLQRTIGNQAVQRILAPKDDPQAIQSELGSGQSLDSQVQGQMETAFGSSFSDVQVHTDANADAVAKDLNARAFTVGNHVAFEAGEYQPGQPLGDALIAHELAHVQQQRGADSKLSPMQKDNQAYDALEADADRSATGVMGILWGGFRSGAANVAKNAMPRLRSGLQLQRCGNSAPAETEEERKQREEDQKKLEEVKTLLGQIPTGQEAIKVMNKYSIPVTFGKAGGGSYHSEGSIVLDRGESATDLALTFVHEINHARYFYEKLRVDISKTTREEYVKGKVEEEAEGTVKSIEAKMEFEGTTVDVSKSTFPLETQYRTAYNDAINTAKTNDPSVSKDELARLGREAGKNRVIKGYMDGEVVTSTNKKPYPEYYGEAWDKFHHKK